MSYQTAQQQRLYDESCEEVLQELAHSAGDLEARRVYADRIGWLRQCYPLADHGLPQTAKA